MSSEFQQFTEAVARTSVTQRSHQSVAFSRIAVLGGGYDARLLAALCLAEQADVVLFSAYGAELATLRNASGISLRGDGPVGTYQVDREAAASIKSTAELDRAVADAEVIFLTGPIHKQRTYAMVLADHLVDGQVLVLTLGRSFGALETAWLLRVGGCTADVTIVETQGLPYWIGDSGAVLNLSEAAAVSAATLPAGRPHVVEALQQFLPNLQPVESVLKSSFADGSALVEFPVLLLRGPALDDHAIAIPTGAKPLSENDNFAALIGDAQRNLIGQLADERAAVARAFGIRGLDDADGWIEKYAGAVKGSGGRPVPGRQSARALLRDGIIGSLVPLRSAAQITETAVPLTESMIALASAVLEADVSAAGRRLSNIGISHDDVAGARRAMDAIATGGR